MNDELQKALAAILTKTTQAAEAGVSFLSQQLPEVIQQLLIWKAVESGIVFVVLLVVAIVTAKLSMDKVKEGRAYKPKSHYDDASHIYAFAFLWGSIAVGAGLLLTSALAWLQILVAPKVYLIEYAASLAK